MELFVIDAFADRPFVGNPAAVCLLSAPVSDNWMQLVAREMNLSETAFLLPVADGFSLRWFTPSTEVELCGHATLASAFMLWETGVLAQNEQARFSTKSDWLTCQRVGNLIKMDFPALSVVETPPPPELLQGLGVEPIYVGFAGWSWLVEVAAASMVRAARPDFGRLASLGVILTARADVPEYDFVSRFFAPIAGINEDPVTGSAHCALGPYWQAKLGKSEFTAYQASARGGVVRVGVRGDRVLLGGQAVMISRVELLCDARLGV